MWTYEVLPLRVDIDNYILAMWHVLLKQDHRLLKAFIGHPFGLCLTKVFWCGFPQIHIYISYMGNRLLQVILVIALHDCVTSWSYQDSLMCMVLNSNLLTYAFCEVDLGYLCIITPGNYFQYNSLSLTIEIHVCGNFCESSSPWILLLIALFYFREIAFASRCLPCLLWISLF